MGLPKNNSTVFVLHVVRRHDWKAEAVLCCYGSHLQIDLDSNRKRSEYSSNNNTDVMADLFKLHTLYYKFKGNDEGIVISHLPPHHSAGTHQHNYINILKDDAHLTNISCQA